MALTFLTEYSGSVPNRKNDTPIAFAENVYNYQIWINQNFVTELNIALDGFNNVVQEVSNNKIATDEDVNTTNQNVLLTNADVELTHADVIETNTNVELSTQKAVLATEKALEASQSAERAASYDPLVGNSATATKLATPRKINGVNFDGSEDITLPTGELFKPISGALFTKVNAYSISIPVGTKVLIGSSLVSVSTTATLSLNVSGVGGIDTGTKAAGTDYNIYALSTGEFILSISKTAPLGYTTANSKRIGGFHYGVIPEAFTAINNITSTDATKIAGINQYSFWDLKFRPICDPSGMAYIFGRWYDLYLCNVDHHTYGTSAAGKTIAGGAVINGRNYPKIPLFYGGDGSVTYGTFTWFEAAEIAKAHSKDLISYNEFVAIAYGVLEASSASTADTGITQHLANYTSKFGICMATGCQWIWGKDLHMRPDGTGWAYHTETEGRGSLYAYQYGPTAAIFGGTRDSTSNSGSRASYWNSYVWNSGWDLGCRFACDHLELA